MLFSYGRILLILLILSEKRKAFCEISDIVQTGSFLARGSARVKIRSKFLWERFGSPAVRQAQAPSKPWGACRRATAIKIDRIPQIRNPQSKI